MKSIIFLQLEYLKAELLSAWEYVENDLSCKHVLNNNVLNSTASIIGIKMQCLSLTNTVNR